jgi:two-component system chemotaxis response regulator CheY
MSLGRVLIVDDEPDLRKAVRLTLTKAGYDVVEAEDGEKGIAALRSGDNPLLVGTIICDLQMPKVNGVEAITFFRAQFPSVPIIVMTGAGTLDIASELYRQGVVEFLSKPVAAETLIRAVEKAIKQKV